MPRNGKHRGFDPSATKGYFNIPRGIVRDIPTIGLYAYAVYSCLAYYQRVDMRPFLAVRTIAALCKMGTTKARQSLRKLEERGWIATFRRDDCTSEYVCRTARDKKHPLEMDRCSSFQTPTPYVAPRIIERCPPRRHKLPNNESVDECAKAYEFCAQSST